MLQRFKFLGIAGMALALTAMRPVAALDDTIAPAPITTLQAALNSAGETVLSWWTTGDDGMTGTATSYEIGYSTAGAITDANWSFATPLTDYTPYPLVPREAGSTQLLRVYLQGGITYWFAIRVVDEAGNRSGVSNCPMLTPPDVTAPAAVTDLVATSPGGSQIVLSWTATGDDDMGGTAARYEIRRNTVPVTEANWTGSTIAAYGTPLVSGTAQSVPVGVPKINYTYCFAMKTRDEAGNWSPISNWVNARARK